MQQTYLKNYILLGGEYILKSKVIKLKKRRGKLGSFCESKS